MDSFTLSTVANSSTFSFIQFISQPTFHAKKSGILNIPSRKPRKFRISASNDEAQLDEWDKMELKFGRMIGEDPKITLAKIMGRKSNPDVSYLEIEKSLDKKKGRALEGGVEEIPFGLPDQKKSMKSVQGLNLVRPVPKKGIKFETTDKPVEINAKSPAQPIRKPSVETKSSVPDVILRKPRSFNEDDGGSEKSTRFGMRPNLSLRMGKEPEKERFSDITLLRKPEQMKAESELGEENSSGSTDGIDGKVDKIESESLNYGSLSTEGKGSAPLLQKPELMNFISNTEAKDESPVESTSNVITDTSDVSNSENQQVVYTIINQNRPQRIRQQESVSDEGLGKEFQADLGSSEKALTSDELSRSIPAVSMDTVLQGKPTRLDRPVKLADQKIRDAVIPINRESLVNPLELENFLRNSPVKELEDDDWAKAEELVKTREREEVELISASTRGFVVSFGSLIGFLPYRNLAARWKFLAFESWLRRKGLDPSLYRQNLGIIGKYGTTSMMDTSQQVINSEIGTKTDEAITSDMKLEDLLMIYDRDKLKFLSSFIGQRIHVGVVLADRNTRRLILSIKPKEKEELVEKKRDLMIIDARLSVGDVVKCCITKITYFGVFVEIEGVPALIHQTEVSWDATLDPASYFKVGQIIDAKVHQLDFLLERIFLSLKEIMPDPLMEALEAVVGDHNTLDTRLEATEADTEWPDVESLIKELEQFDGIQSVSKGRYFLSPGLAPTFQVYMASMFENQYKLLARAGNRVQEVKP